MGTLPGRDTLAKRLEDDSGQAASEYALLVMWSVVVVMVSIEALEMALLDYYQDTASLICLPIP